MSANRTSTPTRSTSLKSSNSDSNIDSGVSTSSESNSSSSSTPRSIPYPDPSTEWTRQPNEIRFKMVLYFIDNIDAQKQSFFANFYIGIHDRREETSSTFAFQMAYDSNDFNDKTLPIWHITLLNAVDFKEIYKEKKLPSIRKFKNSTFMERQHVNATFYSDFHLECFPFDSQLLKIIVSLDAPAYVATFDDTLNHHSLNVEDANKTVLEKAEWKLDKSFYTIEKKYFNKNDSKTKLERLPSDERDKLNKLRSTYDRLHIYIPVTRQYANHIVTILLPLAILNLSTLMAFTEIAQNDSLTLISTLLLSVFTLKWSLTGTLPKLSYNCTMDKLFILSYFYMFACMCLISFKSLWSDIFTFIFERNLDNLTSHRYAFRLLLPYLVKVVLIHVVAVFFRHKYNREGGIIYNFENPSAIKVLGASSYWFGLNDFLFNTDKGANSKPQEQTPETTNSDLKRLPCTGWSRFVDYALTFLGLEVLLKAFDWIRLVDLWCSYSISSSNMTAEMPTIDENLPNVKLASFIMLLSS